jgi:hypothetical protein
MRAKSFVILAVVTALAVIAALALRPPPPTVVAGVGEKVFGELPARLDAVAMVRLTGPDGVITLERGESGWTIRERGGYPASLEKLRGVILALLDLERAEPKTAREEGFERLGLRDGAARELSVLDAAGAPLARIFLGKTVHGLGGETSQFIRVAGEERAWLVRGHVDVGTEARDWIDRRLIDVPAGEVKHLHIVRPDGTTLTLRREAAQASAVTLAEVAPGKRPKRPEGLASMISTFTPLDVDDVRAAADVAAGGPQGRIELVTFDGRTLTFVLLERDGERWLQPIDGVRPPGVAGEWAYRVPGWKIDPLLRPVADLVEDDPGPDATPR